MFLTILHHILCTLQQDDCLPEDLNLPQTHADAGIDHVEVMDFLNLKRATPIHAEQSSTGRSGGLAP
jgi:hypothetical protein